MIKTCFAIALAAFCLTAAVVMSSPAKNSPPPTFSKDVAPIFYKNCAGCHRAGEIAPMSLLTYKEVRPWARSIREKVAGRQMPPWHADPQYGSWENDRRLSQKDIDTIVAWVDAGAPEGNAKDVPPMPGFAGGWQIGQPDQILYMP